MGDVTIEFQMGPLRDRLLEGAKEYEVPRGRHGWSHVDDPRGGAGRVRYDGWRDRLFIESPVGSLQIQFRLRNTTFDWAGRTYRITPMIWGHFTILAGDRPLDPEDLGADGGVLGRHQESNRHFVLGREQHPTALDPSEFRSLQIGEEGDLPPAQLVDRVVAPDAGHDLPSLIPEVHLEDVQLVRIRMLLHVHDAGHADVEPLRGIGRRFAEFDLREERHADEKLLPCRHIFEGVLPPSRA